MNPLSFSVSGMHVLISGGCGGIGSAFAKAFLFFDKNGDQMISKSEFIKGVEGLRVKLPR